MKATDLEQGQQSLLNRTGIMTHPELSAELIEGAKQTVPSSDAETADMSSRASYIEEGLPIGSRPAVIMEAPDDGGEPDEAISIGPAESASQENGLAVLLDKLGERLAFERQGTRLYEACLKKSELLGEQEGGPSLGELRHICEEEMEHFKMLQKVITDMGGDATVQTPSADVAGVLSQGVLQIVSDPRTTMMQTLQAMLVAELSDNDGWEMLCDLASAIGHTDLEEQCHHALDQEQEHLANVRQWLSSMTLSEANLTEEVLEDDDAEEDVEEGSTEMERRRGQSETRSSKRGTQDRSKKSAGSRKRKSKAKK
jgi:rubrerythrin